MKFFFFFINGIIHLGDVVFLDINKKVAFVTGSSIGLGKGIVIELAKNGCNVVIGYNTNKEKSENLKKFIEEKYKVKALSIKCDVTNEESIKNTIGYIVDNFDMIDIIINNAAYAQDNYIDDKTKEEFMKVLKTNLVGPFLVSKYAYKYMSNGIIINISSKDAVSTYNDISMDYCASKAGLNSLTKTLSLALKNIKVISVMPGWIDTESIREMNPEFLNSELKRIGQEKLSTVEDVSKQIVNIIKDDKIKSGKIIELED